MKKILTYTLPVILLSSTLSSCGGSGINTSFYNPDFGGNWQSTTCEEGANSYSFIQKLNIVSAEGLGVEKRAGATFENKIKVWNQPNCPSSIDSELITIKGNFFTDNLNEHLDSVCKNGKAYASTLFLIYLKSETETIGGNNEEVSLETDKNIRKILTSKKLNNLLPYFNLMCVDRSGKLYTGDTETGDGSTLEKRPTRMNLTNTFNKII